jgi:predicted Zn-dependent protease
MLKRTLISNSGERREIAIKTGWEDITVAEYIEMQGKTEEQLISILTGLDIATLSALDNHTALWLAEMLKDLQQLPELEYDLDIEYETIGQYERAKRFLKQLSKQKPNTYQVEILPILYGLYKAEKVNELWSNKASMQLAEEAKQMPVSEVVPFALHIMKEITRVAENEKLLNDDESDPDAEEAGANELEKFGFYPTLHLLSGGNMLLHDEILQISVARIHTHLRFLKTSAEIQKNLSEIKREKQSVN